MNKYIEESLAAGNIHRSSPAGAGFCLCGEERWHITALHPLPRPNFTVKNRYTLPLMSSAFELLQEGRVFSKLDLCSAYHRIRHGDDWKTAFNTPSGHYESLVMLFGLSNCQVAFQCLINDVFRDMLNKFVFVYLDFFPVTLSAHPACQSSGKSTLCQSRKV